MFLASGGDDDEDEFGDIDWCDASEAVQSAEQAQHLEAAAALPSGVPPEPADPPEASEPAAGPDAEPGPSVEEVRARLLQRRALRRSAAELHRALTLCFMARLRWLSGVCDDPLVQAVVLSRSAGRSARAILSEVATQWWPAAFGGPSTGSLAPGVGLSLLALPQRCALLQVLAGHRVPSAEERVLLLVARCRAEALPARVCLAMPLPPARSCGSLLGSTGSMPSAAGAGAGSAEEAGRLPPAGVWAEVYDADTGRWSSALEAPPQGSVGGVSSAGRWPGAAESRAAGGGGRADAAARLWVLAAGAGGGLRDVTRRYAPRWSAVVAARGSLARGWDAVVERFALGSEPSGGSWLEQAVDALATRADSQDKDVLLRCASREPVPRSRAALKNHAAYILASQLSSSQVVHPPDAKPVGLFQGKEHIWRRADVAQLRSSAHWRREGRVVCQGERPQKKLREGSSFATGLFGEWQTETAPKAEAAEGPPGALERYRPIPGVNVYGNVELLDAGASAHLPPGVVHLADEAVRAAVARLGVPFAPAVVGFQREHGQVKPRFCGAVVWALGRLSKRPPTL